MPSTYTDSLRFEEQGIGENSNTWGQKLNTTLDLVDKSIAGHISIAVSSGTTVLSSVNNAEDQARYRIIELTGTLTGNVVIQTPEVSKEYIVWNSTTVGAFGVSFRLGAAGATVAIPANATSGFGISTDGSEWRPISAAAATTTSLGTVELATDAEAQTQTSTSVVLTPSNLGAVTATATRKGIVELSTDAEAQTGTDTARALTPANLQAVTATETRKGVIELATDAEVQTGTDTTRAVTAAGLTARTATETRTGVIEVATQAEVNALADTTRAVVPGYLKNGAKTTITSSASGPTGGVDGDVWMQV